MDGQLPDVESSMALYSECAELAAPGATYANLKWNTVI